MLCSYYSFKRDALQMPNLCVSCTVLLSHRKLGVLLGWHEKCSSFRLLMGTKTNEIAFIWRVRLTISEQSRQLVDLSAKQVPAQGGRERLMTYLTTQQQWQQVISNVRCPCPLNVFSIILPNCDSPTLPGFFWTVCQLVAIMPQMFWSLWLLHSFYTIFYIQ